MRSDLMEFWMRSDLMDFDGIKRGDYGDNFFFLMIQWETIRHLCRLLGYNFVHFL